MIFDERNNKNVKLFKVSKITLFQKENVRITLYENFFSQYLISYLTNFYRFMRRI